MYEVMIWVPTKGWKSVGRRCTKDGAIRKADQFHPLEVQVTDPDGNRCYMPATNWISKYEPVEERRAVYETKSV